MCSDTHSHEDGSEPTETEEGRTVEDPESTELNELDDEVAVESGAPAVDVSAPDQIVELYGVCIEYVRRALGMELDFTDETLPVLDHYLSIARTDLEDRPQLAQVLYGTLGAYFGELVRRRVNGYWVIPNPDFHSWRVCARHVFLSLNPIGVVCEALAQTDDHGGPSAQIRLAPEDRAFVAERLANVPPVPENQYYLLSTRLEAIDIIVETLYLAIQQAGSSSVEFEVEDYESVGY
jgi:hypothetical protein